MNKTQRIHQQHKAWLKHQKLISAGYIKDRFPEVTSIKIKRTFVDFDTDKHFTKDTQEWNIPVTAHALFEMECPMYECVDGGFNLTNVITEMIKNNLAHKGGSLTCSGWQDQERVGQYRCMTKLLYEINIEYS